MNDYTYKKGDREMKTLHIHGNFSELKDLLIKWSKEIFPRSIYLHDKFGVYEFFDGEHYII